MHHIISFIFFSRNLWLWRIDSSMFMVNVMALFTLIHTMSRKKFHWVFYFTRKISTVSFLSESHLELSDSILRITFIRLFFGIKYKPNQYSYKKYNLNKDHFHHIFFFSTWHTVFDILYRDLRLSTSCAKRKRTHNFFK